MSNNYLVTRRQNIVGLAASLTLPALPAMSMSSKIDQLSLYGPPAGPSVTLAHVVASGRFLDIAENADFTAWRNPDELRAGLIQGKF
ncbi:MAG: hypothetical protein OXC82_02035 [Rhodobacteraceae bacterium]|nr:hypothetical protein [Paracoccaceae bacterium]MCY4249206.1 hypothetical protein [Paracoccaceae bacterium]